LITIIFVKSTEIEFYASTFFSLEDLIYSSWLYIGVGLFSN